MTTMNYVDNILSVFDNATDAEYNEGMYWYINANGIAWGLDHINYKRAAGVIAALSPLLSWNKNVEYAERVYAGDTDIPCLKKNAAKAIAIRNGWNALDVLSGQKVVSFYNNIVNPYSDDPALVTIDKHAMDIANNEVTPYKNGPKMNTSIYREYVSAYSTAAGIAEITPLQMQAVTWVSWRNLKKNKVAA